MEKVCSKCNLSLPLDAFNRRPERKGGVRSKCRDCEHVVHAAWRERNPGRSRTRNLWSKYKMTPEEYFALLDSQGGGCGICGSPESGWKTSPFLHVDHNHETGEIRGLLCHGCNIAVGCLEKSGVDPLKLLAWFR